MKILLVTNKTLSNGSAEWMDGGHWNFYLPLLDLGHEVYFYDTVKGDARSFSKIVDDFKPELIFCCMTGDRSLTPREPWEGIINETQKGNCKTFNWFCDDTWRFESFSGPVCDSFYACSTTEPDYIKKFKDIGYDNIIVGGWHTNHTFYPQEEVEKKYDIVFIGQMNNPDRNRYIEYLKQNNLNVKNFHGLEHKDMLQKLSESRIGINFSKNYNGQPPVLQMKLRPFEIAAANNTLVLSEYHIGLEYFFEIDKEIVCFKGPTEMAKKAEILLKNDTLRENIATNGNKRYLREHSSHKRMKHIIEELSRL